MFNAKPKLIMCKLLEIEHWWLVIDNTDNEPLAWYQSYQLAKASLKYRYIEGCRLVRGVCGIYDNGDASPWSCGASWSDAKKNFKNAIFDNFKDY